MLQLRNQERPYVFEINTVQYLLQELRPEMMRVDITKPQTYTEFLPHLQKLTHVEAMARHALLAMPSHLHPRFDAPLQLHSLD